MKRTAAFLLPWVLVIGLGTSFAGAAVPEPKVDQSRLAAVPEAMKQCIADHEMRANFPNSDDSPVRKAFQQAAAAAIE